MSILSLPVNWLFFPYRWWFRVWLWLKLWLCALSSVVWPLINTQTCVYINTIMSFDFPQWIIPVTLLHISKPRQNGSIVSDSKDKWCWTNVNNLSLLSGVSFIISKYATASNSWSVLKVVFTYVRLFLVVCFSNAWACYSVYSLLGRCVCFFNI